MTNAGLFPEGIAAGAGGGGIARVIAVPLIDPALSVTPAIATYWNCTVNATATGFPSFVAGVNLQCWAM